MTDLLGDFMTIALSSRVAIDNQFVLTQRIMRQLCEPLVGIVDVSPFSECCFVLLCLLENLLDAWIGGKFVL
jgi:hypothetical protein